MDVVNNVLKHFQIMVKPACVKYQIKIESNNYLITVVSDVGVTDVTH